jgi:acyl-coenzyme A thioesterase PaaI-like protein
VASPKYDAKYRKHDDAPGRVIPAALLSPDPDAATLGVNACKGTLAVGDEHYEPWGTPHGGVIAELAVRCMAVQALVAVARDVDLRLVTAGVQFTSRWLRGEAARWTTTVVANAVVAGPASARLVTTEANLAMAGKTVTEATATFLAVPTAGESAGVSPCATHGDRIARYLSHRPSPDWLVLPVHRSGWTAGHVQGYFETVSASYFVALDEALAAAANTVRGDVFGDDVAEDFLLADLDFTLAGETPPNDDTLEYEARIRRSRSGREGMASARLTCRGRVIGHGRGRVVFLHDRRA